MQGVTMMTMIYRTGDVNTLNGRPAGNWWQEVDGWSQIRRGHGGFAAGDRCRGPGFESPRQPYSPQEVFGDARVLNLAAGRMSAMQQQQEEDRDVDMAEGGGVATADPEKDLEVLRQHGRTSSSMVVLYVGSI